MSFFTTSDGKNAAETGNTYDAGGGDFEPIPKGTDVLASIDEAKWDTNQESGETVISLRWAILAPPMYSNRKIFQKVRVEDKDSKKADKARRMLAAIDANAGGKLVAAGVEPTNDSMSAALMNKPMVLKLGVWELDDKSKAGNWVMAVSPRKSGGAAPVAAKPEAPKPTAASLAADYDADVGF